MVQYRDIRLDWFGGRAPSGGDRGDRGIHTMKSWNEHLVKLACANNYDFELVMIRYARAPSGI